MYLYKNFFTTKAMKVGDYFVENTLQQSIANSKGKMSTQFMSADVQRKNPFREKTVESIGLKGYDVNVRKPMARRDGQQLMSRCSEFWIS